MNKLKQQINKDVSYPEVDDLNLQNKIYKKREFYYHKHPEIKDFKNYQEKKAYRDSICGGKLRLYTHQSFLSNFISPNTPYKGLLIFHGVGTGKTGTAITIAQNFRSMVKKYNTKIHILVPGPLVKESWKNEIIKFTGQHYFKDLVNKFGYLDEQEEAKAKKNAYKETLYYYKIMTHRSFYKKVLGEKIRNENNEKGKYRTTDKGEIERDISVDKIDNLDNTLLIIDEIHHFTGNEHGEALEKILSVSKNLKILLLSATPMKNLADDVIEIMNYIRPQNDQIRRDKIFTSNKDYKLDFKKDGKEYFQKMCNGYISYYRGSNPLLFAKKIEVGEIPPELIFTKCVRCKMNKFQYDTYTYLDGKTEDPLERNTSSVANCVLPILSKDKKEIIGITGESGINNVISNLKSDKNLFLNKLNEKFFNNEVKNIDTILYESTYSKNITGLIFKKEYIKYFSTKFDTAFKNISDKVKGKKGSGTIFVYSNLVKVGIEIFQEILLQNGYLEFKIDKNYNINSNTIDYETGIEYKDFDENKQKRKFIPATFIKITGKGDEDDELPEEKQNILNNYFNNIENVQGKLLKIILGSKVMNEGITLENTSEVHILDVYYNFGRVEQIIGRAVRQCKHYAITNENNPYPEVRIYKYVVKLDNKLSSDENLYRKAELKYLKIKEVERLMKEVSVDCPINYNGNVFKNEVNENKNCIVPKINKKINKDDKICPIGCDFMNCDFICYDKKLNFEYYDRTSKLYKKIGRKHLDYNSFKNELSNLAKFEVNEVKKLIIELYKEDYLYTIDEIIKLVKLTKKGEQYELFEESFVYMALDQLIPETENEHNNFKDTIYDKYNIPGYLIYRGSYYIFQPYEQDENVPMIYRKTYNKTLINKLSLTNYINNNDNFKNLDDETKVLNKVDEYDFISIDSYYNKREEFDIVGIIDKYDGARKLTIDGDNDIFKIRDKQALNLDKKRGEGITSLKGAVCYSSKDKKELARISKLVNIKVDKSLSRIEICNKIKNQLLYNEKYTSASKRKTYMIIPYNHPIYLFPYNLEDRIKFVESKINKIEKSNIKFTVNKKNNGIFLNKRSKKLPSYEISFNYNKQTKEETKKLLKKYNFKINNKKYTSIFE